MITLKEAQNDLTRVQEYLKSLEPSQPIVETPIVPLVTAGMGDPNAFWDYIRGDEGELFPTIKQSQVDGIIDTLNASVSVLPLIWLSYVLATEYHETAKRMQPVREGLAVSDEWRRKHLRYYPWYGRGEIQLTWEFNYKAASEMLQKLGKNVDLIKNPDLALDPKISTLIMIHGMLEGLFTGKKLRDYIPATPERKHYVNARRIVNGTDRADLIAGYAIEFEKALRLGDWK